MKSKGAWKIVLAVIVGLFGLSWFGRSTMLMVIFLCFAFGFVVWWKDDQPESKDDEVRATIRESRTVQTVTQVPKAEKTTAIITAPVTTEPAPKELEKPNPAEMQVSIPVDNIQDEPATDIFYVGKTVRRRRAKWQEFDAVGESHYYNNFLEVGIPNPDWDMTRKQILENYEVGSFVRKYIFDELPVQIIRERDNPYDKNALRIDISGQTVGYIARKDQGRIEPTLKYRNIIWKADVNYGPVKAIREDEGKISVREKRLDFSVKLSAYFP